MDKHTSLAIVAALAGLVAACGGGDYNSDAGGAFVPGPAPPPVGTPAKGRFVDSAVQNLSYTCGAVSGLTSAIGEFDYLVGQTCSFAAGGIALGSTVVGSVVTPRELVANALDETHPTVNNIARLLLSLDDDVDPSNGIVIADSVRSALAGATLNVHSPPATFAPAAQALLATVIPGRPLVDAAQAAAHLRDTLLGLLDGHYNCQYGGSGYGTVTLDISQGVITGVGRDEGGITFQVSGTLQSSGSASLGTGTTSSGATFTGTFWTTGSGAGSWQDSEGGGTWGCIRA